MSLGYVLAALFTVGWLPPFLWRTEEIAAALPVYQGGERISTVATAVVLSVHMFAGCLLLTVHPEVPPLRALMACAVFLFGLSFWFWGRKLISPLQIRRMPDEPPLAFHRGGAFGIVRHPLYFSYLAATAAPVVATLSSWLMLSYAACAALLAVRAVQEEKRLRAQLGAQYEDYCREVKRLVPFVW